MVSPVSAFAADEPLFPADINVKVPSIASDSSIRYDYDIVYVRALRAGDEKHKRFYADFSQPVTMEPGADLMLLHTALTQGVCELKLDPPVKDLPSARLTISIKDHQGNLTRIERTFTAGKPIASTGSQPSENH